MFSKPAESPAAPQRPATAAQGASRSVLGPDLRITGELSSTGSVEVMGEIEGTVTAKSLSIGAEGRIAGSVTAEATEVRGKLDGTVDTGSLTLRAAAQVTADVAYRSVVIESGAQIEGRFTRKP